MKHLILFFLLTSCGFAATIPDNTLSIGKPSGTNKTIIFNKGSGASNPKIRWNNGTSKIQFSDDGSTYTDLANNNTVKSYSGYHADDCAWVVTQATFADFPTPDASCTFTVTDNNNFGTVNSWLSGGDKMPGITFTPAATGTRYFVIVSMHHRSDEGTGTVSENRLLDGNGTIIDDRTMALNNGTIVNMVTLQGIYVAPSTSTQTLKLQIRSMTGASTGHIRIDAGGNRAINWTIFELK